MKSWLPSLVKKFPAFVGRKVLRWTAICMGVGFGLALVEYGLSVVIQLLLVALGVVKPSVVPEWLRAHSTLSSFSTVLLLLTAIGVIRFLGFCGIQFLTHFIRGLFGLRVRLVVIYHLLHNPSGHYVSAADTNYRLGELLPKSELFLISVLNVIMYGLIACCLFAGMLFFAFKETLVCLLGLLSIAALLSIVTKTARRFSKRSSRSYRDLQQNVERSSRNWMFLRIAKMQQSEFNHMLKHLSSYFLNSMRSGFWTALSSNIPPSFGILLLVVVLWLSKSVFATPSLSLLAFLYLFVRFIQQLRICSLQFAIANENAPQVQSLMELFPQAGELEKMPILKELDRHSIWNAESFQALGSKGDPAEQLPLYDKAPSVEFDNVSFRYNPGSAEILTNFSLAIPEGSQLGVMGPSGSGKSTLMGLLLALLKPTQGKVLVDGMPASTLFAEHWLPMGYVGPEPFLAEGTLRENLLYGIRRECSDEEIWDALKTVQLAQTVQALPGGLEFALAENLEGLSTGQKQRLSLARALLSKPRLLLLDEVSANIDTETESLIAEALALLKGTCTVCIISHREGILQHADYIVRLSP